MIGLLWTEAVVRPMTNALLVLYAALFNNFGLAILAFTIIMRLLTFPLTLRQLRSTQKMSQLQPRIKEVNDKYKDDPQRRTQATMALYKEMGISPIGCLGPMVIQMPIWIGLYWAINNIIPFTPENLVGLSHLVYSWLPFLNEALPVNRDFLWLDLGVSDPLYILPILSGVTMFVQQKMTTLPTTDPRQQSTNQMMLWMMPMFFTVISLNFPSGLVLYWVISNVIGIVIQYFVTGWGGLRLRSAPSPALAAASPAKENINGKAESGDDRENGGGGDRARDSRTRRQSRRSRSRRS